MAQQITATLPALAFPKEVDYPTQEDWAEFSAAAEANFAILGGDWSTQMQLWKTEANLMSSELNTNSTLAQGLANYQGDWTSKGYTLGQTVSVSGIYYICKLTHATGQNPTTGGSIYWNLAFGNWNLKVDSDMSGYTSKATPVDADLIPLSDSAASFGIKKLTWANLKATLLTSFGVMIGTSTAKTTPAGADIMVIGDSAATNATKQVTLTNLKNFVSPASSETVSGIIELATSAEAQTGTDDLRAITPLKLRNALNASGTAPIYAARAWVNFNGTGTVAIRASGNVSSITDNGVGDYSVNFTSSLPANYCCQFTLSNDSTTAPNISINGTPSVSSARVVCANNAGAKIDVAYVMVNAVS